MTLIQDKKEIILKCEKDEKTKNIPFSEFLETLNKYKYINFCQLCKEKNNSEKYYLCKTCSNNILCQECFSKHNKKDEIIEFKIDSTCKKHIYKYEKYCKICKENKCKFCLKEHDINHYKKDTLINFNLFDKKKLDILHKNIQNISEAKKKINEKVDIIINELKKKLELIENLKDKFFELLNMQEKFTKFVYQNYQQKLKECDLNYFIIKNLENQINFNILDFKINENDIIENKIKKIISYFNQNIKNQFQFINKELVIFQNDEIKNIYNIKDVNYQLETKFNFSVEDYFEFNELLFLFYNYNKIKFLSKKD